MFYFVFSASNTAKPEEFPRKPLGLELSLNPVAMKGNVAANGQNGRMGEHPLDKDPHPYRGPRELGETTVAEARTCTLQGEAAEATDIHLHLPGGGPPGEEGWVEPSETQAHDHLLPSEQPLLVPSHAMVDHKSVSLPAPDEHGSLDSSLQNMPSPPDSSSAELSATDHAVWQPAALLVGEQESSLCKEKALDAPPHPVPDSWQQLSSASQHDGSSESKCEEEMAEKCCRAALLEKTDLKRLASKAASTGELAGLQQNRPGSTTGTAHWPESLGIPPAHGLVGGSVPVLSSSELEAAGLGEGCPFQQAPSPAVEGNSPYTVIKTTTPLHVAHATEQGFSNRKQVALPLPETGRPMPATSMAPPLVLDPEEVDAQKSLQKPLNTLKAPRPPLSPKPKLPPQVAKSHSENSFLSGSPPLTKLPKSVTF